MKSPSVNQQRSIRLLQINLCSNILSTGKICEGIGISAIRQGWDSYIAYGMNETNPSTSKTYKIGGKHYLYLPYLESLLFDNHSLGMTCIGATKKLIREIERIKPDIIQLHTIHCYYLNLRILFSYFASINTPIVWTLHDCWAFTGHCSHFSFVRCFYWKTGCRLCPQLKEYPKSLFFDNSAKNYAMKRALFNAVPNLRLVTVSKWLECMVRESFLGKHKVSTIYNGVDLSVFKPTYNSDFKRKYHLEDKFLMVGVASSWTRRKGIADYCRLANEIGDNMRIIMIGMDKKQQREMPSSIIHIRKTYNAQELAMIYSSCDVVLNLSYEETFGMTTVEGLACGTPGIVYNTTASPELVDDKTGIVVPAGNIQELIKAINTIKSKGKIFYSEACKERATRLFNSKTQFEKYIEFYNNLTGNENTCY